jgi:hypothetical protein
LLKYGTAQLTDAERKALKKAKKAAVKNNNAEDKKKGMWLLPDLPALFSQ